MTNEVIFATQVASLVAFVFVVFGLYRLLVSQKDATIDLLKEKNIFLSEQLKDARESGPDILAERLTRRVKALTEELAELNTAETHNQAALTDKEAELSRAQAELRGLRGQLDRAEKLVEEFSCPYCKAPMTSREFHSESVAFRGREFDVDHEYVSYECGLAILDGKEQHPCPHKGVVAT